MALIDLDHFKQVNDQYGHAVGDQVLQTFAQQARQLTRDADIVARWGGEEFLIAMPETSAEGAALLVERLREVLDAVRISDEVPSLRAAFSAGIAAHRQGESSDQTVHPGRPGLVSGERDRAAPQRGGRCPLRRLTRSGRDQRTSSTGVLQPAMTLVATEPVTRFIRLLWPCEPMMIRSYLPFSAILAMTSGA
jgi:hypothetical protein